MKQYTVAVLGANQYNWRYCSTGFIISAFICKRIVGNCYDGTYLWFVK